MPDSPLLENNTKYQFRFAIKTDIDAISQLVNSAYRGDSSRKGWTTEADLLGGQRTDRHEILALITRTGSNILLCTADDNATNIIASVHLEKKAASAYVGMLTVEPEKQGIGIGKIVLNEVERIIKDEWGCDKLVMWVIGQRKELINWYLNRGFVKTGKTHAFPYGEPQFGVPKRDDLYFEELEKRLVD